MSKHPASLFGLELIFAAKNSDENIFELSPRSLALFKRFAKTQRRRKVTPILEMDGASFGQKLVLFSGPQVDGCLAGDDLQVALRDSGIFLERFFKLLLTVQGRQDCEPY